MSLEGFAKSDELPYLLKQAGGLLNLSNILPEKLVIPVVVDANTVVQALGQKVQHGNQRRPMLEECSRAGVITLHAPSIIEYEVIERAIPQSSRNTGIDQEALKQAWLELRAFFVFHDVSDEDRYQTGGLDNFEDRAYRAVELRIDAGGILSDDKDIDEIGGNRLKHGFLKDVRLYARASADTVKVTITGVGLATVTVNLASTAFHGLANLWRTTPTIVKMGLGALLFLILSSQYVRDKIKHLAELGWDASGELIDLIASLAFQYQERRSQADTSRGDAQRHLRDPVSEGPDASN